MSRSSEEPQKQHWKYARTVFLTHKTDPSYMDPILFFRGKTPHHAALGPLWRDSRFMKTVFTVLISFSLVDFSSILLFLFVVNKVNDRSYCGV